MINQQQTQRQQQKILPQQIQLLNILHLNTIALEQRICDEINDNPFLEEDPNSEETMADTTPAMEAQDYKDWDEYAYDDTYDYRAENNTSVSIPEDYRKPVADSSDFREQVKQQLVFMNLSADQKKLVEYVIDSLNDQGMLEIDPEDMANDISFSQQRWVEPSDVKEAIDVISRLEPAGLGCRSIREFWILQLSRRTSDKDICTLAIYILEEYFRDLTQRNFEKIAAQTNIDAEQMRRVVTLLSTLKMKPVDDPGNAAGKDTILPDFIVTEDGDGFRIELASARSSSLYISSSLSEKCKAKGTAAQYLKSKYNSAVWFIDAIKERERNMLRVMNAIVKIQADYFRTGDMKDLKPMILKHIAEMVELDISSVSRITSNKYADTPFGMIALKKLFNEGIANSKGDIISTTTIHSHIVELISKEDKQNPYTDQQLANILADMGYNVARRTVAKYRDSLHLPMVQMRGRNGFINL